MNIFDNGMFALYAVVVVIHWILALTLLFSEGKKSFFIVVCIGLVWPLFYVVGFILYAVLE